MSYERIDDSPQFDGKTRESHELRYRIAAGFAMPDKFVLDAGCGTGYAKEIFNESLYLGIDKNPPNDPSRFAKVDFEDPNQSYDWLPQYDIFVGLEVIEHLNDDGVGRFLQLARAARKWIIISTPIVPNSNPFHKQHFTPETIPAFMAQDPNWKIQSEIVQDGRYGIYIFKRT